MLFRYPDDPRRISVEKLKTVEETEPAGSWLAQKKWDDWRKPAYKINGVWTFKSKHAKEARIIPPPDLVRELDALQLPDNTALDLGWVGRRDVYETLNGRNFLVLWDLLYWNDQWQGQVPYLQRWANLKTLVTLHKEKASIPTDRILLAETREKGFAEYFEEQKQDPLSEGIVLKRTISKLIGNASKAEDNPHWWKVKYRDIKEPTAF